MYVPKLLDNVRMKDREGVFLVVRVHDADACVDVVPRGREYIVIEHLPFSSIKPFGAGVWRWPQS